MLGGEPTLGDFEPVLEVLKVQVEASLCHEELDEPLYDLLDLDLLREHLNTLRYCSSELDIAGWQDHLVEVSEAQVAIFVMAVVLYEVQQVVVNKLVLDPFRRVLCDKLKDLLVVQSSLRMRAAHHLEEVVALKVRMLGQPLS